VKIGEVTGRTHLLPMVLFAPTARCNSRCLSCDWWRADGAGDLTLVEIRRLAEQLPRYGTRTVVFTGGEALLRPDVMEVADLFREAGMSLQLLTSGLALERFATSIASRFADVTISLDGHTPELYQRIRGVNGLSVVAAGVRRLRSIAPHIPVRARATIHGLNFRHMGDLVDKSREMGLDQISFLTADVTSAAFNREPTLAQIGGGSSDGAATRPLLLSADETGELAEVVESVIRSFGRELADRKVVPGPDGLRRFVKYYRAHLGLEPFPVVACNAPWTSIVIEADGTVRPCFFHAAVGNLRDSTLDEILNAAMPSFRRGLDVATNPICQRCVCTLKVGLRSKLW
jgi:MoaA/NifB/PqqE/SkfB family radical SAM enzyme